MASLDSPNPSFAIRETATTAEADDATAPPSSSRFFIRSISTKEPSFSTFPFSPPPRHLSSPLSLHSSPLSSPHHPLSSASAPTPGTASSYRCVSSVLKKDGQVLSVAAENGFIYTGSDSNVIRIWKLPEFKEYGQLKTKTSMAVAMEVSHDRVYAAYGDGKIRVWRRTWGSGLKHARLATIPKTGGSVRSYIVGKDKTMKHTGTVTSLAINVSDDLLYSASIDKTIKVWRIRDFKCVETIQAHSDPINAIVVADDGVLYSASDDATVRVWRRYFCSENQLHTLIVTLPTKYSPVKTLSLTLDDGLLYGGCTDGYIHYWHKGWFSAQLQYGGALRGHTHAVMCLASVGSYVVSGSADSTCRVWVREQDGKHTVLAVLAGHRGPVRCVNAFLGRLGEEEADDEYCTVCTGSLDGVLKTWRVTRTRNHSRSDYFELQEG